MALVVFWMLLLLNGLSVFAQSENSIEDFKAVYESLHRSSYSPLPHKSTYILPYVYNWMPHEDIYEPAKSIDDPKGGDSDFYKNAEAEFQISFAVPVFREMNGRKWDLLIAYTHHAWWQVYNADWSRPFRETNYTPEIFTRYLDESSKKFLGLDLIGLDLGYVHQSNGQIDLLSRSWDRLIFRTVLQHKHFNMVLSAWYRLPEKEEEDDNHDIYNFMGIGELELTRDWGPHRTYFKVPILATHPSYDFKYSYPLEKGLRWYFSYQSGYGHSLIEYNRQTQRLGVGFILDHFFL